MYYAIFISLFIKSANEVLAWVVKKTKKGEFETFLNLYLKLFVWYVSSRWSLKVFNLTISILRKSCKH